MLNSKEEREWREFRIEKAKVNRLAKFKQRAIRRCTASGSVCYMRFENGTTTVFDADKLELVVGYNWSQSWSNGKLYFHAYHSGRWVLLHRVLVNAKPKERVDHRDGDTLNNMAFNLRANCRGLNNINCVRKAIPKSGFHGVWFDSRKHKKPYSVKVAHKHVGSFENLKQAAEAYINAVSGVLGKDSAAVVHLNKLFMAKFT